MVDEMIEVSQSDCQIKMSEETCTVIFMVRYFMPVHSGSGGVNSVHSDSLEMASTAIVHPDNRAGSLLVVGVAGVVEVVDAGQSQEEVEAGGPVDKLAAVVDDSQQEVEEDSDVLRANWNVSVIVEVVAVEEQDWRVRGTIERLCADVRVEMSSAGG